VSVLTFDTEAISRLTTIVASATLQTERVRSGECVCVTALIRLLSPALRCVAESAFRYSPKMRRKIGSKAREPALILRISFLEDATSLGDSRFHHVHVFES
jgi:hypothetical protein